MTTTVKNEVFGKNTCPSTTMSAKSTTGRVLRSNPILGGERKATRFNYWRTLLLSTPLLNYWPRRWYTISGPSGIEPWRQWICAVKRLQEPQRARVNHFYLLQVLHLCYGLRTTCPTLWRTKTQWPSQRSRLHDATALTLPSAHSQSPGLPIDTSYYSFQKGNHTFRFNHMT